MSGAPDDVAAILTLADWRRRIGSLYADVRRLAEADPAAALDAWRATREELYRSHPQSPVPEADRGAFQARHFAHDPALRFEVAVEPVLQTGQSGGDDRGGLGASAASGPIDFGGGGTSKTDQAVGTGGTSVVVELPVSAGGAMAFRRFGAVTVPLPDGPQRLELYWMEGYAGGLFLPFRDATNGSETYGAGRYLLDAAKSADLGGDRAAGSLILDFNFAFQPSCAFDPKWACPLAPPANRLAVPIRAGERLA